MINLGLLPRGKYMEAVFVPAVVVERKTPVYVIRELNAVHKLGEIRWYGPWRGFCFFPSGNAIFDGGCLQQIREWMTELNTRYKQLTKGESHERLQGV